MKTCPNCNSTFPDTENFCASCGTPLQASQPQQYTAPAQPQQYAQPQQPAQKKKNKSKTIAIVAVVLIILAVIGSVAQKTFQQQGYGQSDNDAVVNNYDDNNDNNNEDSTPKYAYTKGTFDGTVYTNEWADLKFDATTGWVNASADMYANFEGEESVECGVILIDSYSTKQIIVTFEDLKGTSITASEYLSNASGAMQQAYTQQNLTSTFSTAYDTTIAGETFVAQTVTFAESDLVVITSARVFDDHAIYITATAQSYADASMILNSFTTAD